MLLSGSAHEKKFSTCAWTSALVPQCLGEKLGRKPVLYGGGLLKGVLGSRKDQFFGSHRLWLAQYGDHPAVQPSWSNFWLWQYTDGEDGPDMKTVTGIPGDSRGRLDCDHYPGSPERLAAEWAS